jgi:hypothetical protein
MASPASAAWPSQKPSRINDLRLELILDPGILGITIWQPGMNPVLPRTTFYKDTPNPVEMAFDKGPWCWYRFLPDGTPVAVAGVTTVLKCIHKPALLPWGIRVCLEKMKALLIEGHYAVPYLGTFDPRRYFHCTRSHSMRLFRPRKTDSEILTDSGDVHQCT